MTQALFETGTLPVNAVPTFLASADLNGDGKADLVAVYASTDQIGVTLGPLTSGSTTTYYTLGTDTTLSKVQLVDVTGDGKPDIVATDSNGSVIVLVNNGNGTFGSPNVVASGLSPLKSNVAVGDVTGDGKPDLVYVSGNGTSNTLSIYAGTGAGTFSTPTSVTVNFATFTAPILGLAQLTSTGGLSAVMLDSTNGAIAVVLNTGTTLSTNFTLYQLSNAGGVPSGSLRLVDVNGDGKPDIIALVDKGGSAATVEVLLNNGDGTFAAPVSYAVPYAYDLNIADVTGGALRDIVAYVNTSTPGGTDVAVLPNNGNGTFGSPIDYSFPNVSGFAAAMVGNYSGNGRPGIAIVGTGSNIALVNNLLQATVTTAIGSPTGGPYVVVDSAANIAANLDGLQTLAAAGQVEGIRFTDIGPVTLTITGAQFTADPQVVALVGNSASLVVTGASVAQANTLNYDSQISNFSISDTAANISAGLANYSLLYLNKLQSITISDNQPLSVPIDNLSSDYNMLTKVSGNYTIVLTAGGGSSSNGSPLDVSNGGTLTIGELPFAATDSVTYQLQTDPTFAAGGSTLTGSVQGPGQQVSIGYQPGLITAANQGADNIVIQATDTTTNQQVTIDVPVQLDDGPSPIFTPASGAPIVHSNGSVVLGTVAPGFQNDALRVLLLADSGFISGGSSLSINGSNQLVYTAGIGTSANAGFEGVKFALFDRYTGAGSQFSANYSMVIGPAKNGDTYGSGKAEIVLQNRGSGQPALWSVPAGNAIAGSVMLPSPGANWSIAGTGDFNGDGYGDLLFRAKGGNIAVWEMQGASVLGAATVANPGNGWMPLATGDLNGDGTTDIVFQNTNGQVALWTMNGPAPIAESLVANPGTFWHVVGAGDLNGDGKADIVLQGNDGTVAVWFMNGASIASSATIAHPGTAWRVAGVGDLNGDGKADIVLQATNGTVAVWTMNGATITGGSAPGNPGVTTHVVGVEDISGSGKDAILLQGENGNVSTWLMNGTTIAASSGVAAPGPGWNVLGTQPMTFIGAQAAGTYTANALIDQFDLTTWQAGSHVINGFDPTWDIINLPKASFASFAAVQAAETSAGGGTVIALGGSNTLTINGVLPAALTAHNFLLT